MSRWDYIKVGLFGFALNVLWTPMGTVIMPLLVLEFVAESQKSTYLGLITFAGLLLAVVVQPVAGTISDTTTFKWGRRRPYIIAGSVLAIILLVVLGSANSLLAVLVCYCLLQVSMNVAHGPWQGLLPDMVPKGKRGIASGVKGILEVLGAAFGVQVVGYFLSQRFSADGETKLFLALGTIALVIAACMLATVLLIKERRLVLSSRAHLWASIVNTFTFDVRVSSSFVFFLVSRFLFLMPLIVLRTFGFYFLRDVIQVGDPVAVTSDLMLAVVISLLIVMYPAGYLADRIGRRLLVAISGIIAAVGFVILLLFHTYPGVMLAGVLIGIANGCFMSANWAMATDLVAKGDEARLLGLTNLATGGSCAIAAFAGPLVDLFNAFGPGMGFQVVVGICVLLLLVSAALMVKIKTR